jgi:hypothetical protein
MIRTRSSTGRKGYIRLHPLRNRLLWYVAAGIPLAVLIYTAVVIWTKVF